MNIGSENQSIGFDYRDCYACRNSGNIGNPYSLPPQCVVYFDDRLRTLGALIENIDVSVSVILERFGTLGKLSIGDGGNGKSCMKAVQQEAGTGQDKPAVNGKVDRNFVFP